MLPDELHGDVGNVNSLGRTLGKGLRHAVEAGGDLLVDKASGEEAPNYADIVDRVGNKVLEAARKNRGGFNYYTVASYRTCEKVRHLLIFSCWQWSEDITRDSLLIDEGGDVLPDHFFGDLPVSAYNSALRKHVDSLVNRFGLDNLIIGQP